MVQSVANPLTPRARFLHDLSTLAGLSLLAVPLYFVVNDYWQSLLRLSGLYLALGIFCLRLGHYTRRVMRREPAEIPPWEAPVPVSQTLLGLEPHVQATEAIRSVHADPHYLQEVLKPRLQQMLIYRVWGIANGAFETLEAGRLAPVDPTLVHFLRRRERTGLWARYVHRQQRVKDVLEMLQRLETL